MTDTIAVIGVVATPPSIISTGDDLRITSFRLASTQRRFDRARDRWIDGETNWYTVTAFRQLAVNIGTSVVKGDKVVVTGRLRVRDWENGDKKGTNVDIEAVAVGHNLAWGTTTFTKAAPASTSADQAAADQSAAESEIDGDDEYRGEPASGGIDGPLFAESPTSAPF